MNVRRLTSILFWVFLAGVAVMGYLYYVDTQEEYHRLQATEAKNHRRLEEARKELQEQEKILQRLRTDPAYVERVIRRKLGYAKPDESLFRFDD